MRPRRVRLERRTGRRGTGGEREIPRRRLGRSTGVGRLFEEPLLLWRYGQEVEAIKPKIERRREFRGTWRSYRARFRRVAGRLEKSRRDAWRPTAGERTRRLYRP